MSATVMLARTWLSMRRDTMSMGRWTCPMEDQKCPPCGCTATRSPALICTQQAPLISPRLNCGPRT